jgi:hypothetical protein
LNIYNDTTKGFLAFLLRIKQAHTDGLLGNHWGEVSGKRADIISEWCVVAGEKKLYPSTFELVQDIIAKMGNVTVDELEAIGIRIEAKNINTKFKRFYSAEFLRENPFKIEDIMVTIETPIEEVLVNIVVEDKTTVKAKKPKAKVKKAK